MVMYTNQNERFQTGFQIYQINSSKQIFPLFIVLVYSLHVVLEKTPLEGINY